MLQHLPAEVFPSIVFYLIGDPYKTYSLKYSLNFNNTEKQNYCSNFEIIDHEEQYFSALTTNSIVNGLSLNSIDDLIDVLSLKNTHPLIKEKIYNNSYIWSNIVYKFPNLISSKHFYFLNDQFTYLENDHLQFEKLRINLFFQLLNSLFDYKFLIKSLFVNELFQITNLNKNENPLNNFLNIEELIIYTNCFMAQNSNPLLDLTHLFISKKIVLIIACNSFLTECLLANRKEIINFIELNENNFEIHLFNSYKTLQNNYDERITFDVESFGKYCKTVVIDEDTPFSNLIYFTNLEDLTIMDVEEDIVLDFNLPFLKRLEISCCLNINFNNFIANNLQKLSISSENIEITKLQKPFPNLDYLNIAINKSEDDIIKFWLNRVLFGCCEFKVENVPSLKELLLSNCDNITINNLKYLDKCTIINSSLDMDVDEINILKIEQVNYYATEKTKIKINKKVNEYFVTMNEFLELSNFDFDFKLKNINYFELIMKYEDQIFTTHSLTSFLQKLKVQSSKKSKFIFKKNTGSSLHALFSNFNLGCNTTFKSMKKFINCLNNFQETVLNNDPSKVVDVIVDSSKFLTELNIKDITTGKKLLFLNNNETYFKFLKRIFFDEINDLIDIHLDKLPLLKKFHVSRCKAIILQTFKKQSNLTTFYVTNVENLSLSLQLRAKKLREFIIRNITNLFIKDKNNYCSNPIEFINTPKLLFKLVDLPQPKKQSIIQEQVKDTNNSFVKKLSFKIKKNYIFKLNMEMEL
ncbi:hypothetical protein ABK040_015093 [Willaertia magna]